MEHILRGIGYVTTRRKLWPYVWGPMFVAALVFIGISILARWWLAPIFSDWIARTGLESLTSGILGQVAFTLLWWLIASMLYVGIAGVLSAFLWERLSREIEILEGTLPNPEARIGCAGTIWDTVIRSGISLFVGIAALLTGWLCFGIPGIVLAGWIGLLDFSSCAFARRGVLIGGQLRRIYGCKGWPGFLIGSGVISLFPLLNVLLLPALVAGGTLLCAKGGEVKGKS